MSEDTSAFVKGLTARVYQGDMAALARAISLVDSSGDIGTQVHRAIYPRSGKADVVGITGPPGAGKSTLVNSLIRTLRERDKRVAVIAVDPSSPITGGAVLGDRTRMGEHTEDDGVYIRSLSSRGHLGGLSANVFRVVDLIDAAGWDSIVLETVGAGQSETEVAELADVNVVVNAPGLGDDVQAIKAGILEIADILVVNKADSPLAQATERQLKSMLGLRREESQKVPIISTTATTGDGVNALVDAISDVLRNKRLICKEDRQAHRATKQLAQEVSERVKHEVLSDQTGTVKALASGVLSGELDRNKALDQLLRLVIAVNDAH